MGSSPRGSWGGCFGQGAQGQVDLHGLPESLVFSLMSIEISGEGRTPSDAHCLDC